MLVYLATCIGSWFSSVETSSVSCLLSQNALLRCHLSVFRTTNHSMSHVVQSKSKTRHTAQMYGTHWCAVTFFKIKGTNHVFFVHKKKKIYIDQLSQKSCRSADNCIHKVKSYSQNVNILFQGPILTINQQLIRMHITSKLALYQYL